jgi:hypothetical protein
VIYLIDNKYFIPYFTVCVYQICYLLKNMHLRDLRHGSTERNDQPTLTGEMGDIMSTMALRIGRLSLHSAAGPQARRQGASDEHTLCGM